jgi:hypothetical protein
MVAQCRVGSWPALGRGFAQAAASTVCTGLMAYLGGCSGTQESERVSIALSRSQEDGWQPEFEVLLWEYVDASKASQSEKANMLIKLCDKCCPECLGSVGLALGSSRVLGAKASVAFVGAVRARKVDSKEIRAVATTLKEWSTMCILNYEDAVAGLGSENFTTVTRCIDEVLSRNEHAVDDATIRARMEKVAQAMLNGREEFRDHNGFLVSRMIPSVAERRIAVRLLMALEVRRGEVLAQAANLKGLLR